MKPAGDARRTLAGIGEFGLIRDLAARLTPPGGEVLAGIGDDCAVLDQGAGRCLLWTVDILLSGRHFEPGVDPFRAGWKALAVSLSDIAAMGGKPLYALVFAALPPETRLARAREIYRGIGELADRFGVRVLGGDTSAARELSIGTTVIGETERENLVLRSGARPGDLVCLTGPLGDGPRKHLSFLPRVAEGREIARSLRATAMIDISDGLLGDLGRITEASGVGARLGLADIPRVPGASPGQALVSGEEFELLFTVAPEKKTAVSRLGFFVAGEITSPGQGLRVLDSDGSEYRPSEPGYDHFRPSPSWPGGRETSRKGKK